MTAVEWLEKELIKRFKRSQLHYTDSEWCFDMIKKLSEQAKEIEKQQIIFHSVELCKLLLSNPIEKSGKQPEELIESYFKQNL
jgi:hypothetical protein